MGDFEVIETRELDTEKYGTILFSNVKGKGWTFQYSKDLIPDDEALFDNENCPWVPEYLDELDDDCFDSTYEEAEDNMFGTMNNNEIMGLIVV